MVSEAVLNAAPENELIRNTMKKADLLLNSYKNPVCSVSGGSDSDVMLDLLERVRGNRNVTYVFFNTGIEYRATLRHLDDLESKYGIEIVRRKAKKPVPGWGVRNMECRSLARKSHRKSATCRHTVSSGKTNRSRC